MNRISRPPAPPAPAPARAPRSPRARFVAWRARAGRDEGFTLVEQIIAIGLATILGVIGVVTYQKINRQAIEARQRVEVATGIDDANGQLLRDVNDAMSIRAADAQHLTLAVIRDGACVVRDYTADTTAKTLSVVSTFYEQASCSGASEATPPKVLLVRYTQPATFTYWGESETIPIPSPVEDVRNIRRVQWELAAEPYVDRDAPDVTLMSSQFFDGRGESSGSGTPELQAKRPLLTLTTEVPGRDAPSMTWTDPTPTLTAGWVVTRAREAERLEPGSFLAIAWPDAGTLTFTDTTLQPGERATYVVYAILTDGSNGPSSNSIDTGLRPDVVTGVVATGQPTAIKVDWVAAIGATGYDVYRDGSLAANVGATTTYTDALAYGHTHDYRVVATNRWEQKLTTGSETGRLPIGDAITKTYSGGVRLASAVTAAAGAFTAPAAPTITATPNANWSNTVTRTYAAWVGTGPTSKAGAARDRGWEVQAAPLTGGFTDLWSESTAAAQTHSSRPAGATTRYQARTCNASGCGPYSPVVSALQRPPAPASCTTAAASTRGMQVTVNPAGME
ncbi:MAG: type II secretion system protein, partial [Cellulomonadaceae bacterium]|nr:type II secretion system protein [Cellulomonadaceae bacterium]